jgi:tetratricopeptide (TPR) repeat protein
MPKLKRHIVEARRVEPDLAEAYLAETLFIPWTNFIERGRLIDKAVNRNPSHAGARALRSQFFGSVGRMDEAVREAREAVRLDPLSPAMRDAYVASLAYDGSVAAALEEIAKAERLWPGAASVIEARYRVHLRYGNPKEALRLISSRAIDTPIAPVQQTFLDARVNPSPENVEKAIRQVRNLYPRAIGAYSQTLAEFGRKEELLRLMSSAPVEAVAGEDAYFRPAFSELHKDRRFMRVAARIGLLSYWRATGKWPDFCSSPGFPYDCKREAEKLSGS